MPLFDILQREYNGVSLPSETLCELCYIANVSEALQDRAVRSQYKFDAMRLHKANHLTGRMIWACGYVLHLLEGRFDDVEARFGELKNDVLHLDSRQLVLLPIASRRFSDWTLYSLDIGNVEQTQLRLDALAELCGRNMAIGAVQVLEIFLHPMETLHANENGL
jgi:hypothetical protein